MTPAEQLALTKPKRLRKQRAASNGGPFYCVLLNLRQSVGLTLDDVSNATHISKAHLHAVEQGAEIGLSLALRIAGFFGRDVTDIWKPRKQHKR